MGLVFQGFIVRALGLRLEDFRAVGFMLQCPKGRLLKNRKSTMNVANFTF